ncbi:4'-phosphopantetheinyl transferase family protein [Paenibacillus sp. P13VS]|uniref:4'-phosphopantetheinyl transferase family protein n=1 Tax=Paenibacillus sp. P13VS TaxID=2697367 RepID=UPI00187B13E9|nr:4'-phosphopantetheinyl transferase superfamily protein [Paenibacillus sp. P13VS]MBE7684033.1 4'-phosphopantetheinyl transferase superfamily protein [Paenibacillus sp. P13VS]
MINIQVLRIPAEIPNEVWHSLLALVSAERRQQAARFVHQADAYRSVLGEALARVTLGKWTGARPGELVFIRNTYGKPSLISHPDLPFNVSHSGDWVAVISGGHAPLGVDVEKVSPIDMAIAERFFSPLESRMLAAEPAEQQLETFYRLWTLKESYIKAIGMGLSMPLDSFSMLRGMDELWYCPEAPTYQFFSQRLDEGHMLAATCSTAMELPTKPDVITIEELYSSLL